MSNVSQEGMTAKKAQDFDSWYTQVILKAEIADYSPVSGCLVFRPSGYAIWENIQRLTDAEFKKAGISNTYFPIFIPERLLKKEAQHVKGFAPEVTKKVVDVEDHSGKELSPKQLHVICEASYTDFAAKFLVYKKLREAGYVVTPGIKFGSDFAVYEHGPGIDHAPYIVQVMAPDSKMTATSMVRSGRLATTVRKQFIIAIPSTEGKSIEFLRYDWWRA